MYVWVFKWKLLSSTVHVLLFIMLYSLVLTFKFVQRLPGRVNDLLDGFVDIGFQSWILCFAVMLDSTESLPGMALQVSPQFIR